MSRCNRQQKKRMRRHMERLGLVPGRPMLKKAEGVNGHKAEPEGGWLSKSFRAVKKALLGG